MKKMKMELVWHNCKTCPPKEEYNECLYVWDGHDVLPVEWYGNAYHFIRSDDFQSHYIEAEKSGDLWWADLSLTTNRFFILGTGTEK